MSVLGYCYLAVFLLMSAAVVILLRLDTVFVDRVRAFAEKRAKVKAFKRTGKLRRKLNELIDKCCQLIIHSQIPMAFYIILTVFCAVSGYIAGRAIFVSLPISLALGTIGLIAPLLFFNFRQGRAKSAWQERLCSSMMILSNSYVATENFISSVRDNLDILDYPDPFREFVSYVTYMDSNIETGLRRMERKVNNAYFSQWIDALVLAQEDRTLKYVTVSVVDSMHDVLQVQAESDAAMYAVWRDYLLTLILIFSVPLVFKVTLADAYITLTTSAVGQAMFILLLLSVIYSVLRALKINRPLMM